MDHQRFSQCLPALYHDWGQPAVRPRSPRFAELLTQVRGMTSPGVLQVLNFATDCLEHEEVYAEVGTFQGATLIGALFGHPARRAYAADNFSEFDPQGHNLALLGRNLAAFGLDGRVAFSEQDGEEFLLGLRAGGPRVGVYFYDGAHDYRSQLLGLLLAVPALAAHALVVVDDANTPAVRQATWDFLAARPEARLLWDLPTPANCHPTFWNGLLVLTWDAGSANGYDRPFHRRGRQPALLRSIYALQNLTG